MKRKFNPKKAMKYRVIPDHSLEWQRKSPGAMRFLKKMRVRAQRHTPLEETPNVHKDILFDLL